MSNLLRRSFSIFFPLCLLITLHTVQAQNLVESEMSHQMPLGISGGFELEDGGYILSGWASNTFDSSMALMIWTDSLFQVQSVKRYKTLYRDDFSDMIKLADGNYLVGGAMRQDFNPLQGAGVFKIDQTGNVMWNKIYSEENDDRILNMFEQSNGTLMLFIRHGVNNKPTKILHTNADGDILSQTTYANGTIGVFAEDVTAGDWDVYYMTGTRYNGVTSNNDLFVCAVDDGEMLWYKLFDFGRSVSSYSIAYTNDGHIAVAGNIVDALNNSLFNVFLMRLDDDGNIEWTKEFSTDETYTERCYDILAMDDGSVIVTGYAGVDGMMYKSDDSGNLIWSRAYNHFNFQSLGSIQDMGDGRLFVIGNSDIGQYFLTTTTDGTSACSSIPLDIFSADITPSSSDDTPIESTSVLVANTPSYIVSSDDVTTDLLCTGFVGVEELPEDGKLTIYPTLCVNELVLEMPDFEGEVFVTIVKLNGQVVVRRMYSATDRVVMDVSDLSPGMYGLKMEIGGAVYGQVFVKQ